MASEDYRYRNTRSGRLVKATRLSPASIPQRRTASASVGSDGQATARRQVRLGGLISDLSASLIGRPVDCLDGVIAEGLRHIVEGLGVDQGAFYERAGDGLTVGHSWPVERFAHTDPQQADDLAGLATRLSIEGALVLSQPEAGSDETREDFLSRLELKSAALVGVMRGGSLLGALMLGSSHGELGWTEDSQQSLQILGAVFADALAHKRSEERLLESDRLSHAMLDSLEIYIIVVEKGGEVIAVSEGRHCGVESGVALLTGINEGANYFDVCRLAGERGFEPARKVLEGIEAVAEGSQKTFEMEYEHMSPAGRRFFQVSATPRTGQRGGAVISHIETTERRIAQASLRELSGKMITSLEEERRRIARELHDDVSQRLALMGIEMEQIIQSLPGKQSNVRRRLRNLWGRNQETSLEVRRLSHNLHSSKLDYLGLVAAVKGLCNDLSTRQGLRVRFKHLDVPSSIPKDVALCIYRVVQESLRNAIKHSGAQEAQVELSGGAGEINLCISDEGAGFDADIVKAKGGIGLIGMRERLLLIGGDLSIESQIARGTRIVARIPLPELG